MDDHRNDERPLTQMQREIATYSAEELDRELAFAEGFGNTDEPNAATWLYALRIAKKGAVSEITARLEYLRGELRAERISWGELAELQSLVEYIDPGDLELLEAAGVPEEEAQSYLVPVEFTVEADDETEAIERVRAELVARQEVTQGDSALADFSIRRTANVPEEGRP